MNAVAKVKKEDAAEIELDNPLAPPAGNPTPVALRIEPQAARPPSPSAAAAL